jgi:hypothetical protein
LLGERRRELIITARNMEILTGYLLVEFNQQKQCGTHCGIRAQGQEFNGVGGETLLRQVLAKREAILIQNRLGHIGRILTAFRELQWARQVAFRHPIATQTALFRTQPQWPIRLWAVTNSIVSSTQMKYVCEITAMERFQRQPELSHIGQRKLMGIRDPRGPCFSRKARIQSFSQRLDSTSSAPLTFEHDNIETIFL